MKESKKGTASRRAPDLLKGQVAIKGDVLTEIVIESKEVKRDEVWKNVGWRSCHWLLSCSEPSY